MTEQLDILKVQLNAVASLGLFYTSNFGRVECN